MTADESRTAREEMAVRTQRALGELDEPLRRALIEIPREPFLSAELTALAYDDRHLPTPEGQTLLPPEVVARLLQALQLKSSDRVLEVGTGVGYTAALLSRLAADVYSVERLPTLLDIARAHLQRLGCRNVQLRQAGAELGWPEQQPFDAILVSASALAVPRTLRDQLAVGGRLVMPIGSGRARQTIVRVTQREPGHYVEERLGEVRFVGRVGDILVESGSVTRDIADEAAGQAAATHRRVGELLHDLANIPESDIYRALAAQRGLKFGSVDAILRSLDLDLVRSVPRSFLEHNRILPVQQDGLRVTVVSSDPDPSLPLLSQAFPKRVLELVLVTPTDYRRLWTAVELMLSGQRVAVLSSARSIEAQNLLEPGAARLEAHFVQLFEAMLVDAIGERASDIHLERFGDRVRLRIRVDGDLREVPRYRLTPTDLVGIINVIKIRSGLDIAEHRLPQGGRMRVKAGAKAFDLRIQIQPTLHGEHAVIRLLPQDVKLLSVEELGFQPDVAAEYRRLLDEPAGLVLVVGPTGSGKTTTLYAGLQILASDPSRKVITVEDPIEYAIDNVQQSQVQPEIGFAFADAMRSFVRQDPDVILVGEIRDAETALEAIRASQTGHLVLSTLHCNDATDAVQRLIDLGMHPNSVGSELLAVLAQRLARRICDACRRPAVPPPDVLAELFPDGPPSDFVCFEGAGCTRCSGYGTHGRVAVVEFLRANSPLRAIISRAPAVAELRRRAFEAGLLTMRDCALSLVRRGVIGLGELRFLLSEERMAPERPSPSEERLSRSRS